MADEEQLEILRRGVADWNAWRERHGGQQIDLQDADLRGVSLRYAKLRGANLAMADFEDANLRGADLRDADLSAAHVRADLRGANLRGANLSEADFEEADLSYTHLNLARLVLADLTDTNLNGADLKGADLTRALLTRADLREANLGWANLTRADPHEADLSRATLHETLLADLDLSTCKGLESCRHDGPSMVDVRTLQHSGPLPFAFLRGVGLPDALINHLPSLLNQAIQMYSCFISYSAKDEDFARRLHADLQDKGVRCWFAPEDMKIGAKILDTLDEAIRLRDKVLLVLSEASIASEWVEDEVTKAFAEERQRGGTVLFPIRVDDAVFKTNEAWASKLRDNRHIGDFRNWKEHNAYRKGLDRLLRDLQIGKI